MTTIATRVRKISDLEGFDIVVKQNGTAVDVKLNGVLGDYPFAKKCRSTHSVKDWKEKRFEKTYPGFSCDVLNEDGNIAHGNTKLDAVRASYEADD